MTDFFFHAHMKKRLFKLSSNFPDGPVQWSEKGQMWPDVSQGD